MDSGRRDRRMSIRYCHYDPVTFEILGFYSEGRKTLPTENIIEVTLADITSVNDNQSNRITIENNTVIGFYRVEPTVTIEEQRLQLKAQRDNALNAITHDFGDGRIVQVRPEDVGNFQIAISSNVTAEWVMENNTVEELTVAELQTAFASGVTQGKQIYDDYMQALKALY